MAIVTAGILWIQVSFDTEYINELVHYFEKNILTNQ